MRGTTVLRTDRTEVQDPLCTLITDSKGVYDALNNELPQDDKKSEVDMPIIEQIMTMVNGRCRWIPHNFNLRDALTKIKGAHLQPCLDLLFIRHVPSKSRGCEPSRSRSGKREDREKSTKQKKYQTPNQPCLYEHELTMSEWFFHFCSFVQLNVKFLEQDTETPCSSDAHGSYSAYILEVDPNSTAE